MDDTKVMAFKTDLQNVNWKSFARNCSSRQIVETERKRPRTANLLLHVIYESCYK